MELKFNIFETTKLKTKNKFKNNKTCINKLKKFYFQC